MADLAIDSEEKRHPIQVVSRRSGLTPDVLRAWEKRYGLIVPERSAGGRRMYSDADIDRLRLIREAVAGGRRVGQLATLSVAELEELVQEDRRGASRPARVDSTESEQQKPDTIISECLDAVRSLDSEWLRCAFGRAVITLQPAVFMDAVATPLMHQIGTLWAEGHLSPGQEHLASSVVRHTLAEVTATLQPTSGSPNLVVATPSGQRHGIAATLVAATAQLEGWHVTHLGEDLPAGDIAHAVEQTRARAVALSITHPKDDPTVVNELRVLRQMLPTGFPILVGGQAAESYRKVLNAVDGIRISSLPELRDKLRELGGSAGS